MSALPLRHGETFSAEAVTKRSTHGVTRYTRRKVYCARCDTVQELNDPFDSLFGTIVCLNCHVMYDEPLEVS